MNLGKVLNVTNARDGHLPLAHLKEDSTKSLFLRIVFPKEGTALRLAYGGRTSSLLYGLFIKNLQRSFLESYDQTFIEMVTVRVSM